MPQVEKLTLVVEHGKVPLCHGTRRVRQCCCYVLSPPFLFSFRGENGFTLRLETARCYHSNCGKDCRASPPSPGGGGQVGGEDDGPRPPALSAEERRSFRSLARAADLPSVGLSMSRPAQRVVVHIKN